MCVVFANFEQKRKTMEEKHIILYKCKYLRIEWKYHTVRKLFVCYLFLGFSCARISIYMQLCVCVRVLCGPVCSVVYCDKIDIHILLESLHSALYIWMQSSRVYRWVANARESFMTKANSLLVCCCTSRCIYVYCIFSTILFVIRFFFNMIDSDKVKDRCKYF